jgi:hypothetical protein
VSLKYKWSVKDQSARKDSSNGKYSKQNKIEKRDFVETKTMQGTTRKPPPKKAQRSTGKNRGQGWRPLGGTNPREGKGNKIKTNTCYKTDVLKCY